MGPFSLEARSQCNILQEMFKKMETLYIGLESYYVFDKQKYTLEEFMSDIKKFKDQFKVRFCVWNAILIIKWLLYDIL